MNEKPQCPFTREELKKIPALKNTFQYQSYELSLACYRFNKIRNSEFLRLSKQIADSVKKLSAALKKHFDKNPIDPRRKINERTRIIK